MNLFFAINTISKSYSFALDVVLFESPIVKFLLKNVVFIVVLDVCCVLQALISTPHNGDILPMLWGDSKFRSNLNYWIKLRKIQGIQS